MPKPNLAARAGYWSATHRKTAIFGWLAFVVIAFVLGGAIGTNTLADEDTGNGQSRLADTAISRAGFPDSDDEQVLVTARDKDLKANDPAFRAGVDTVVARLGKTAHVQDIRSPFDAGNEGQISKDETAALVTFSIPGDADVTDKRVDATLAATAKAQSEHPELRIEQFGGASADKALGDSLDDDFKRAEFLSLPITLIILLVAFGALVAAGVPLLLAITAVIGTLGLVGPISQIVPMEESANSVILLIGLAVGVDYSMFYLRRKMEERDAGRSSEAALEFAAATSGKAVLVSGVTVLIAMAGMFLAGNAVFTSFAVGTMLVVAVAMLGSVTVLPAVLSKLGDNVEKGRIPFIGQACATATTASRACGAGSSTARSPARGSRCSPPAASSSCSPSPRCGCTRSTRARRGCRTTCRSCRPTTASRRSSRAGRFRRTSSSRPRTSPSPDVQAGIKALVKTASGPTNVTVSPNKHVAIVDIPLPGNGTDATSDAALAQLRGHTIPNTIDKVPGTKTYVTGITAGSKDFNDRLASRLPLVFAFVLGLAFLLLLVTFRSIVVPLKAIVLNLLSVGAAYGVLVYVFQDGHFESLLGFQSVGGITSWLPLFLFVILFGLSMDYHVFIISRIREGVDRGMSTDRAVAHGIKATAGVVTSAAVVMVAVFAIFASLSMIEFKQMGVGLAVAILLDATLVRAVLLPAAMKLLGERNWYLPRQLRWLPKFDHEQAPEAMGA